MKIEPPLDKNRFERHLRDEFGLDVDSVTFIPRGEVSHCYLIQCANHREYVVKIYPPTRIARPAIENLTYSLAVCQNLYHRCQIEQISHPISTKQGLLSTRFNGDPLVVLDFIAGTSPGSEGLGHMELIKIGHLLARIHECTHHAGSGKAPEFKPIVECKPDLMKCMGEVDHHLEIEPGPRRKLAELLSPYHNAIIELIISTERLASEIELNRNDFVVCHCDPIGENLIVAETKNDDLECDSKRDQDIFLIDWDGVKRAPAEQDVWFYLWYGVDVFFNAYRQTRGSVKLQPEIVQFLFQNRLLDDLTDWAYRILFEDISEDQANNDLEGIREDFIAVLKEIDGTVEYLTSTLQRINQV